MLPPSAVNILDPPGLKLLTTTIITTLILVHSVLALVQGSKNFGVPGM
jgi:hypothetical protein